VQSADDYAAIYAYLRRTYYLPNTGTWDATTLTTLAATTFASASKEVVITATGGELGTAQGQMKFNKMVLLQAIEALLQAECSDSLPPDEPSGTITNFSNRRVAF